MGVKNREKFHNADWDMLKQNPDKIGRSVAKWLLYHDPVQYAYDNCQACADHLPNGTRVVIYLLMMETGLKKEKFLEP
jgi:hypothetical protein